MTEAVVEVQEQVQEAPQLSEVEQRAVADGWQPKEAWVESGKPESDWRDAQTFIDRGELFKKIDEVKRENKTLKRTLNQFKDHHERVKEVEFKRALEVLRQEKKQALIDGDADRVVEIDDQILETREAQAQAASQIQTEAADIHPDFEVWVNKNSWYGTNSEMREFADDVGILYKKRHPAADVQEVLEYVEKRVNQEFKKPEPKRNPTNTVEASGKAPRKAAEAEFELDEDETRAMNKYVRLGLMTKEQYVADLKKIKGIK